MPTSSQAKMRSSSIIELCAKVLRQIESQSDVTWGIFYDLMHNRECIVWANTWYRTENTQALCMFVSIFNIPLTNPNERSYMSMTHHKPEHALKQHNNTMQHNHNKYRLLSGKLGSFIEIANKQTEQCMLIGNWSLALNNSYN